jgi:hypothetical protein
VVKESVSARAERLRLENEALRAQLDEARVSTPRRAGRWRAVLAGVLVLLGVLLTPVALAASSASVMLEDTEAFVRALAPLAIDAEVQALIVEESVAAIDSAVDIEGLTGDLFDGIASLGLPPRAGEALGLLSGPAAAGVRSLVQDAVTGVVTAPAFADVWEGALRLTHTQLVSALRGEPDAVLTLDREGSIGVQVGPIIAAAKQQLIAQGITFAQLIPAVDRTIEVAQSDGIAQAVGAYHLVVALGVWLPWLAGSLLLAGLLVARERFRATLVTGIAFLALMVLVGLAIVLGRAAFLGAVAPYLPAGAAGSVFDALTASLSATALALLVIAALVAVVAYLAGPFRSSQALRRLAADAASGLRSRADLRGLGTGRFGELLHRHRMALAALLLAGAALVLALVRPLTPALVGWTALGALVLLVLFAVLQRPTVADEDGARA